MTDREKVDRFIEKIRQLASPRDFSIPVSLSALFALRLMGRIIIQPGKTYLDALQDVILVLIEINDQTKKELQDALNFQTPVHILSKKEIM